MIQVYGVPSCDKIKKTKTLLSSNKIDFTFVNVRQNPITRKKLEEIVGQLTLDKVLNRQGMLYRKKGLKEKKLNSDQLFEELFIEQGMIKRPLIEKQGRYFTGYDEKAIMDFVNTVKSG